MKILGLVNCFIYSIQINTKSHICTPELKKKLSNKASNRYSQPEYNDSEADHAEIIHEMEVFQLELEMQNEELQLALHKAAAAIELYDSSPSGYFTLGSEGTICELNLNGAHLLEKKRAELVNTNFIKFVSTDTRHLFKDFLS